MPSLISLTCFIPRIVDKTQTMVFRISGFVAKPIVKKNNQRPRASNDIDMELGPLSKLIQGHCYFPVNLEELESLIPDGWSIIFNISSMTIFYLAKTELKNL